MWILWTLLASASTPDSSKAPSQEGPPVVEGVDRLPEAPWIQRVEAQQGRAVVCRRGVHERFNELVVQEPGRPDRVRLSGPVSPDRVAISADGQTIAFVSGVTGWASVYVMPFAGEAPPVQLTNVGLEELKRVPGQRPPGFVPPPLREGALQFDGPVLRWRSSEGAHEVTW